MSKLSEILDNSIVEGTACEQILGSSGRVQDAAVMWDNNAHILRIIGAYCLHSYVTDAVFTPEMLATYKVALADFLSVFEGCSNEQKLRSAPREE